MNRVGRVTRLLNLVEYRRICCLHCLLSLVLSLSTMEKFSLLAKFGNLSLEELARAQEEMVAMFARYPSASIA